MVDRSLTAADCLDRLTLIVGEINTGKTSLARQLMTEMIDWGWGPRLAVLDLAPTMPARRNASSDLQGVGGKLIPPPESGALYLTAELAPPRLSSKTEAQAQAAAERNKALIEPLLAQLAASGREIVLVNDLTLYLQAATAGEFLSALAPIKTVVANGYHGQRLGQGELSRRERQEMDALIDRADRVIRL